MKKTIKQIGTAIALVVVLVACGKEQPRSSQVVEHFKRVDQVDDERILFDLLTANEKAALAAEHLDFCINYYQLSQAQVAVLESIQSQLLAVYQMADAENSAEVASIELDVNQYFSSLTEEQRQVIFHSMVVDEEGVQRMIANSGSDSNATTNCNCSSSSNYCSSSWGPSILCDKTNKCGKTSWGCGTLWFYSCNGKCKLFS